MPIDYSQSVRQTLHSNFERTSKIGQVKVPKRSLTRDSEKAMEFRIRSVG